MCQRKSEQESRKAVGAEDGELPCSAMIASIVAQIASKHRESLMKVFISHSHADSALAGWVTSALRKDGLEVFDPDTDLLPGDNWAERVAKALEESEAMVVLLTPDAINSPYVRREIEYALGMKRYSNRLIPVTVGAREQLPPDSIPWIVRHMPWVELEDRAGGFPEVKPIADAILSHA